MILRRLLAPRDRRALLVGVGGISLILLWGRAFPALVTVFEYERVAATHAARQEVLARSLIDDAPLLSAALVRATNTRDAQERDLLVAPSPTSGASALAGVVERAAARERVRIGSTLTQGDTAFRGRVARVAVRTYATTDAQGLFQWLTRLEQDPRRLAIRELIVTQAEPGSDDNVADLLRVECLVEALVIQAAITRTRP